jgi:hypothetical protein
VADDQHTAEDQSALEFVRTHPHMFLKDGIATAEELAERVRWEAERWGVSAEVTSVGNLYIVGGSPDWIGSAEDAWFLRLSPAPENGDNSFRQPILLVAFAAVVATCSASSSGQRVLTGELSTDQSEALGAMARRFERVIGFAL